MDLQTSPDTLRQLIEVLYSSSPPETTIPIEHDSLSSSNDHLTAGNRLDRNLSPRCGEILRITVIIITIQHSQRPRKKLIFSEPD
ncbi:hypothetical protein RRG08_012530 [Elysia crispata]|uniref:Uncharacterized protein n=1 Tax=Elysia crispata TaxID=231223 RepID=A0AAE1AQB8_9GAST|nr:hypothetical protein RRG08_012530 [Elysia crispata]